LRKRENKREKERERVHAPAHKRHHILPRKRHHSLHKRHHILHKRHHILPHSSYLDIIIFLSGIASDIIIDGFRERKEREGERESARARA